MHIRSAAVFFAVPLLVSSVLVASAQMGSSIGHSSMGGPGMGRAAPPAAPAPAQQYDIPARSGPQSVMILTRTFAPGQSAGRHLHHGVEMTFVASGDLELMVDGQRPRVYHAGDSFMVPREVPHDAKNVGKTTVTIYVTYVLDRGTPMRVPVP